MSDDIQTMTKAQAKAELARLAASFQKQILPIINAMHPKFRMRTMTQ